MKIYIADGNTTTFMNETLLTIFVRGWPMTMIRQNVIFHERLHDGQDLRKLDLRTDIERIGEVPLENKVVRCVGQRLDHHKTHLVHKIQREYMERKNFIFRSGLHKL